MPPRSPRFIPTKDTPGEFDGIESLKPGEPVFPLQGGDPLSAPLVELWAAGARIRAGCVSPEVGFPEDILDKLRRAAGDNLADPVKASDLLDKATEAEEISWSMNAYRKGEPQLDGHNKPAEQRLAESYSGYVESDEMREARERRVRLLTLAEVIEEAKGHANETAMGLDALGGFPEQAAQLRAVIAELDRIVRDFRPYRRIVDD